MPKIEREYFLHAYERINDCPDYNDQCYSELKVNLTVNNFSYEPSSIGVFFDFFHANGYALIDFKKYQSFLQVQDWLAALLGDPLIDSAHDKLSYSKIFAQKGSKYFSNTHFTQPLHTDDAHVVNTPPIISLFCEKQSKRGGISTLVKFSDVFRQLHVSQEVEEALLATDALKMTGLQGEIHKPLLYRLNDNRVGISFPAFLFSLECRPSVEKVFKRIMTLIHQKNNQIRCKLQPGQLLLIDNFRVLHGRTGFDLSDQRLLYRFCFDEIKGRINPQSIHQQA